MASRGWRSPLLGRLLGLSALTGLLGLAGLWWLHHWSLERHLRVALVQQLAVQADLIAAHIKSHLNIVDLHRHHEGLMVRQELEVLARSYLEMCQAAYRRQQKGQQSRRQAQDFVRQALLGQKVGLTGYPYVWDISRAPEHIILAVHPKIQGTDVAYVDFVRQGALMKRGYLEYRWANPGEDEVRDKVAALEYFEPWQWVICVGAYREEFNLLVDQDFYHQARRELDRYLADLRPGPGGRALVLDGQGHPSLGAPPDQARHLEPELARAALSQEQGTMRLEGPGGARVAVFRHVPALGRLLLLAPEANFLDPVLGRLDRWYLAGLAAWLVLGLALWGVFLARRLSRPLQALAISAEALARGVPQEPPPSPQGPGEMDRLARALAAVYRRFQESLAFLAQSERRYRDLFENSPDPGYVISRGGFVMEINQALERVLGRSRQEVHGQHLSLVLEPGQEAELARRLAELASQGRPLTGLGFTVLDNEGRPRYLEGFLTPLRDGQGRLQGYYGLARDLSEQQQLQQQLMQAQKMEIMGTLAGGIAHDFNNLLSGIMGYSSLLLAQPGLEPRLQRYLEIIDSSAGKAAELTHQLLTLAKVGHAGRQPVDINAVVSDVLNILEHSLQPRVRLEVRLAPDLPVVEADPGQLHQVLMNLCINARDAMPQGGVLLLETALAKAGQSHEAVAISVHDSGQGMDEATGRRALEPFFTTKEQGTGLGLPMAQGIIHNHGGSLEIKSQPGQGTTVRVLLPPGQSGLAVPGPPLPAELVGGSETVLVVDDEAPVRRLALEALATGGYKTLEAANGQQALEVLEASPGPVDLVLLDLMMPGLSGLELLPLLKERHPGLPVILVSGMYDPREEASALWRQAEAFLPKPYRVPALLGLVRRVLDRAGAGRPPRT